MRQNGDKAAAELQRRGQTQPQPAQNADPGNSPEPTTEKQRSRELDEDLLAVDRALTRQRHAAAEAGQPWLPRREPAPEPETESHGILGWCRQFEADIAAVERSIERQREAAIDNGQPWPPEHHPQAAAGPETVPETEPLETGQAGGHDEPDTRITEAVTDMEGAARHFGEEQASRLARTEYAARIRRQAEAQTEAHATLEDTPADAEIEL